MINAAAAAGRSLCGKPPLNPLSCRVAAKLNPLPRNLCNKCSGCYRCYKRSICDMCYIGRMGSILSIRNVPEGLLRRLKVESAKRGETSRESVPAMSARVGIYPPAGAVPP